MSGDEQDFTEKVIATSHEKYLVLIRNEANPHLVFTAQIISLQNHELTLSNQIHYEQISEFLSGKRYLIELPHYNIHATFARVHAGSMVFTVLSFHKNQCEVLLKEGILGFFEFTNPIDRRTKISKRVVAKKHHQIVVVNDLDSQLLEKGTIIQDAFYVIKGKAPLPFNAMVTKVFTFFTKDNSKKNAFIMNLFS